MIVQIGGSVGLWPEHYHDQAVFQRGMGTAALSRRRGKTGALLVLELVRDTLSITAEGGMRGWVHYKSVKLWVVWRRWIALEWHKAGDQENIQVVLIAFLSCLCTLSGCLTDCCYTRMFYFLYFLLGFGCQRMLYRNWMSSSFSPTPKEEGNTLRGQTIKKER